jgi:N-acetylneuraminic acid mutarotase
VATPLNNSKKGAQQDNSLANLTEETLPEPAPSQILISKSATFIPISTLKASVEYSKLKTLLSAPKSKENVAQENNDKYPKISHRSVHSDLSLQLPSISSFPQMSRSSSQDVGRDIEKMQKVKDSVVTQESEGGMDTMQNPKLEKGVMHGQSLTVQPTTPSALLQSLSIDFPLPPIPKPPTSKSKLKSPPLPSSGENYQRELLFNKISTQHHRMNIQKNREKLYGHLFQEIHEIEAKESEGNVKVFKRSVRALQDEQRAKEEEEAEKYDEFWRPEDITVTWLARRDLIGGVLEFREGRRLCFAKGKAYIFGGYSTGGVRGETLLSLDPANCKLATVVTGRTLPQSRAYHSMIYANGNIFVFGGELVRKGAESYFYDDVWKFDLATLKFRQLKTTKTIEGRKFHAVCVMNNFMVVSGGMGSFEMTYQDVNLFTLGEINDWQDMKLSSPLPKIQRHTMVSVYPSKGKGKKRRVKLPSKEGIYIFGGTDGDALIYSDLIYLDTREVPWRKSTIATQGSHPGARFDHCCHYVEHRNYLLVYGGKNDYDPRICLADAFYLDLSTLIWCRINLMAESFAIARYDFQSFINEEKLYVLGGITDNSYIDCKLDTLELDEEKSRNIFPFLNVSKVISQPVQEAKQGQLSPMRSSPDASMNKSITYNLPDETLISNKIVGLPSASRNSHYQQCSSRDKTYLPVPDDIFSRRVPYPSHHSRPV